MVKPLILVIALVLCLSAVGVGYATWYEDLYIDGTATMGHTDVQWSYHGYSDKDGDPGWGGEISKCEIAPDGKTLLVEIINAYPGYWATLNVNLHNYGDVPTIVGPSDLSGVADELTVELSGESFTQGTELIPCSERLGMIKVLVEQTAQPDTTYNFHVVVDPSPWHP